jgi:ABC-2 type transport system permease protein
MIIKEYKHIWFDSGFLFLTVFSPAVLLTLLTYVFSFNVQEADLAILNQDQSPQSYEYIRTLTANGDLTERLVAQNYEEMQEFIRASRIDAVLIIPPGFGRDIAAGTHTPVSLIVDGTDPSTAGQIASSIEQRTQVYTRALTGHSYIPFDVRMRVWFNPNLESQYSMVPGLMALVLILPAMAVALGITREKESGTFETLTATPIRGGEYLIGKLVVYLSMGLVGTLLALGVAVFWFKVPFRGNLLVYLLLTADYLFASMGVCLIVGHFVSSQRTATSIVLLLLFIPSFFQTGLSFPIDRSSLASLASSYSLPATYFVLISRGVALKGLGIGTLFPESLALLGMGLIAVVVSTALFSKKIR